MVAVESRDTCATRLADVLGSGQAKGSAKGSKSARGRNNSAVRGPSEYRQAADEHYMGNAGHCGALLLHCTGCSVRIASEG